jgi:hypothetical protein
MRKVGLTISYVMGLLASGRGFFHCFARCICLDRICCLSHGNSSLRHGHNFLKQMSRALIGLQTMYVSLDTKCPFTL